MSLQSKIVRILTSDQFEAAIAVFPRLSAGGKAAAKSVLVDGFSQKEVAERLGIHRQQVNKWVKDIYKSHLDCPDGWLMDVVVLPPDLMDKVKNMEKKARCDHSK